MDANAAPITTTSTSPAAWSQRGVAASATGSVRFGAAYAAQAMPMSRKKANSVGLLPMHATAIATSAKRGAHSPRQIAGARATATMPNETTPSSPASGSTWNGRLSGCRGAQELASK